MRDEDTLEGDLRVLASEIRSIPSVQDDVIQRLPEGIRTGRPDPRLLSVAALATAIAALLCLGLFLGGGAPPSSPDGTGSPTTLAGPPTPAPRTTLDDWVAPFASPEPWARPFPKPWGFEARGEFLDLPDAGGDPINASPSGDGREVGAGGDGDAALLERYRIRPTLEGVTAFLRELRPNPGALRRATELVEQLSADDFRTREAATQALIASPVLPWDALQKASRSSDPERARRARTVLGDPRVREKAAGAELRPRLLAAVCGTIREKPIRGAVPVLLEILPFLEGEGQVQAACEAVAATAGEADVPLLRKGIGEKDVAVKVASIRGLGRATADSTAELHRLAEVGDARVALAAARALAERGDRACLPVLVRLAGAEEEGVRAGGVAVLRSLTGQRFGFDPFRDPGAQKASLDRWREWLAAEGRTARLRLPLRLEPLPEDLRHGLLLHYAFDSDVGHRLTDVSGLGRHGLRRNATAFVPGATGNGLDLRGAGYGGPGGGHALLPSVDFSALAEFTLALWVNERGMSDKHGEAYVVFGADRGVGVEDSLGISHFNDSLHFRVGEGQVHVPYDPRDRNRWVHYAMTFRGGRLRAYKDGALLGDEPARVSVVGEHAALGRHWWHHGKATSARLLGTLDDLRLYGRALTPSQVQRLARRDRDSVPPPEESPALPSPSRRR